MGGGVRVVLGTFDIITTLCLGRMEIVSPFYTRTLKTASVESTSKPD